jgi:hypothetical protein
MYGQSLSWFQRFLQRFQATPIQMAKAELKDAELAHLQCISMAEYADLRMKTHKLTADYHAARAERLAEYLAENDRDFDDDMDLRVPLVEAMLPGQHLPGY